MKLPFGNMGIEHLGIGELGSGGYGGVIKKS